MILVQHGWDAAARGQSGDEVRWNQIQVIGSHNSYHVEPAPSVRGLIAAAGERQARALEYSHPPLAEQFSTRGVRQIELDLFHDPDGGRYARPAARRVLQATGKDPGPDPDEDGRLQRPGFKILHVPDIDFRSTTPALGDALKQVRAWSLANPDHVPILILLELKEEAGPALSTRPLPFDRKALEAMEAEILSVFPMAALITPEDVRGTSPTLSDAVKDRGWPRLSQVRGRVAFALDNEDRLRDLYAGLHPTLHGQLLFVSVPETHAQAAWFKINDPVREFDRIRRLVSQGFLVRTRADADTREARSNDLAQRDKALASGAQFVSTDYPVPDPRFSPYRVQLPGRVVARSNPVSGKREWGQIDLERRR